MVTLTPTGGGAPQKQVRGSRGWAAGDCHGGAHDPVLRVHRRRQELDCRSKWAATSGGSVTWLFLRRVVLYKPPVEGRSGFVGGWGITQ